MPTTYNKNTFRTTYNDDWSPSKGYYKVLFNGGRALQARELNEMQSIIHGEMARLGSHLFKDGALVNPGGVTVNNAYEYVRLNPTGGSLTVSHVGTTITGQTSGVIAKIVQMVPGTTDPGDTINVPTVYVTYTSTSAKTSGNSPVRFTPGEVLTCSAGNLQVEASVFNPNITPTGQGCKVNVEKGDIYSLGRFLHFQRQSLIISKYYPTYSGNIGFRVLEDIFTSSDTEDLFDNQSGAPNLTSPGADRYRVRLQLTTQERIKEGENFVFLARITNGAIAQIAATDKYNRLNDVLATRTREESGDYIVEPFKISFEEADSSISNSLYMNVSRGVAYVNGYRAVNPVPQLITIPKPTATELVENEQVPVVYDRYFLVDSGRGLPELNSTINLYDGLAASGSTIGTFTVRSMERDFAAGRYRIYVGKTPSLTGDIRDAKSVGTGASDYFNIVLEGNPPRAVVKGLEKDRDLLFRLPRSRPNTITDITYNYVFEEDITGTGTSRTITSSSGFEYTDTSSWIISSDSAGPGGPEQSSITITLNGDATQATIDGLKAGVTYEVIGYKNLSDPTAGEKTKFPLQDTMTGTLTGGDTDISLGKHDVYQILEVKDSANGINILDYFSFDNGQRDTHYEESRLIKQFPYSGPIYAKFNYFSRQAGGYFYSKESYVSNSGAGLTINYKDIPSYRPKYGSTTQLFNVLDFRPDLDASGTVVNSTDFPVPQRAANITADVAYYLPRADKLTLTQEGSIALLKGVPDKNPQYKKTPDGSLDLYKILMNPNTLDAEDVKTTQIETRRYTMADIGKIERKVDRLEEVTSLSLLEVDTKNLNVLDAEGNLRTKSGFFADNFADQTFAATRAPDYRASIDYAGKNVRPIYRSDNIRLIFDSANSSGVVRKGDNVYLKYTEQPWKAVAVASHTEPVNPFLVSFYNGTMKLSPASDEWKDTIYEADKVVDGGTRIDTVNAQHWNEHEWNWSGIDPNDLEVGDVTRTSSEISGSASNTTTTSNVVDDGTSIITTDTTSTTTTTTTAHTVGRIISSETIQEVTGDRVVQVALIPWMRSRKIYFMAEGLRPNTQVFPYFDGRPVSAWCRQEPDFIYYGSRTDDQGNQNTSQTITEHPDGKTDLTTDASGTVIGSFFIPNIRPTEEIQTEDGLNFSAESVGLRFRCGTLQFKVLDISTNFDNNAGCKASTTYAAVGTLETKQREVTTTRVLQEVITTVYTESSSTTTDTSQTITETIDNTPNPQTENDLSEGDNTADNTTANFSDQYDYQFPDDAITYEGSSNHFPGNLNLTPIVSAGGGILPGLIEVENSPIWEAVTPEITYEQGDQVSGTAALVPNCTGGDVYGDFHASGFGAGDYSENVDYYVTDDPIVAPAPGEADLETAAELVLSSPAAGQTSVSIAEPIAPLDAVYQVQQDPAVQVSTEFEVVADVNQRAIDESLTAGQQAEVNQTLVASGYGNSYINPGVYATTGVVLGRQALNIDPVAQTFYVDNQFGIYLTKVALYFGSRDQNVPVTVQIRPEVNGAPSANNWIAAKTLPGSSVNAVSETYTTPTMSQVRNTPTFFEFDEPVFLNPFQGYAICVIAPNTTRYTLYVSEVEKFVVGSTSNRILQQPDLGSFFKSQNSRIWEPSQKLDMMYTLYRAQFKHGGTAKFFNAEVPADLLKVNPLITTSGSQEVYVRHFNHGMLVNDEALLTGLDSATRYAGILGASLLGRRTITKVDGNGYTFQADSSATTTAIVGGDDVLSERHMQYNIANLYSESITPNFTSIATSGKFTTGKPIAGPAAGARTPYNKDTNWTRITPRVNTSFDYPRIIANKYTEDNSILGGLTSTTIKFDMKSANAFVSPMLDLQRTSMTLIENLIDKQDSASTANGQNVPVQFKPETDPYGGTHLAKHITVPITLAEDAVGLKVLLAANKPEGSEFDLYYRTAVEGERINDKSWTYEEEENTLPADENSTIFREYTYLIGGDGGTLDAFSEFQLKIVFRSTNSSKVPKIRDLRAIALVD